MAENAPCRTIPVQTPGLIKWDNSDGKERKVAQQAVIVRTSKISMEDLVPR